MVFLLLWTGVQRHLDAGEVDRGAEESDQRQGKSDEGGTDQTSHPPVQTQRRSLSRPASVWVRMVVDRGLITPGDDGERRRMLSTSTAYCRLMITLTFSYNARNMYAYNSTVVPPRPKVTRTLIGSHIVTVKRNQLRAAPMTGRAGNRVLVPFDFGPRHLKGNLAILYWHSGNMTDKTAGRLQTDFAQR